MKQIIFLFLLFTLFSINSFSQLGTLDTRFANNGLFFDTSFKFKCNSSLLQKDGKIILGGSYEEMDGGFFLMRLNNDGTIDSGFASNGFSVNNFAYVEEARSLDFQPDGKIVAGGSSYLEFFLDEDFNEIFNMNISLIRYLPDGKTDSSFGNNGIVQTDLGEVEWGYSVAIQRDGKIIVGGSTESLTIETDVPKFFLVRYMPNGDVDSSFGINGKVITVFDNIIKGYIIKVLIDTDGSIFACGTISGQTDFALAKYLPNGTLDENFGNGGKVTTRINSTGSLLKDAILLKDGKILTAGVTNYGNEAKKRTVLVQYNSDGSLDESFGTGGKQETTFSEGSSDATALAVQDNGKIVFSAFIYKDLSTWFGLARCNVDGSLDSNFGFNGKIVEDISFEESPSKILIQNDGKLIVTGKSYETFRGYTPFAARYYGVPTHPLFTKIRRWIHRNILNFTDVNGTASQYNIEHQNSGGGFNTIASVLPNKNNSYSYDISNYISATANSNFRIKAVYADGSTVYSEVLTQAALEAGNTPSLYPNPAASVITINGLDKSKNYRIIISNKEAQPLLQTAAKSVAQKQIDIAMLKAGIYFIELKDDVGGVVRLKLVKE